MIITFDQAINAQTFDLTCNIIECPGAEPFEYVIDYSSTIIDMTSLGLSEDSEGLPNPLLEGPFVNQLILTFTYVTDDATDHIELYSVCALNYTCGIKSYDNLSLPSASLTPALAGNWGTPVTEANITISKPITIEEDGPAVYLSMIDIEYDIDTFTPPAVSLYFEFGDGVEVQISGEDTDPEWTAQMNFDSITAYMATLSVASAQDFSGMSFISVTVTDTQDTLIAKLLEPITVEFTRDLPTFTYNNGVTLTPAGGKIFHGAEITDPDEYEISSASAISSSPLSVSVTTADECGCTVTKIPSGFRFVGTPSTVACGLSFLAVVPSNDALLRGFVRVSVVIYDRYTLMPPLSLDVAIPVSCDPAVAPVLVNATMTDTLDLLLTFDKVVHAPKTMIGVQALLGDSQEKFGFTAVVSRVSAVSFRVEKVS